MTETVQKHEKHRFSGFQPPEMMMAQYTPKDVIGDLGGIKVRIPRHCAEIVEFYSLQCMVDV